MEIVNSTTVSSSFAEPPSRVTKDGRVRELIEHLKSQGGQRTLVRLEAQADTEIERTWLLGDPLRSAFQRERDGELSNLNTSVPNRCVRRPLDPGGGATPSGPIRSGSRRPAADRRSGAWRAWRLAEGIAPLYFRPVEAADFFGRRLTGQTFRSVHRGDPANAPPCGAVGARHGLRFRAPRKRRWADLYSFRPGRWAILVTVPFRGRPLVVQVRGGRAGPGDSSIHPSGGPPGRRSLRPLQTIRRGRLRGSIGGMNRLPPVAPSGLDRRGMQARRSPGRLVGALRTRASSGSTSAGCCGSSALWTMSRR